MIPNAPPRRPRMYVHSPTVIFTAKVNLVDPQEYPASFVPYTDVTVGDFSDIEPGMLLLLGTTPGGDDLGRQRVTDDHSAIVVRIGYTSRGTRDGELLIVHGAYITVLDSRRIWSKVPFIDIAGEMFMDGNVEVGDHNVEPPPVAIMRAAMAGTAIDGGLTVTHIADDSYAVADGATITGFQWDIKDGALSSGSLTGNSVTVIYPPGARYPSLTVTDSNGKSHTTRRLVYVDDPEARQSISNFMIESEEYSDAGKRMSVRVFEPLPNAQYPDGAEVLIWDKEPTGAANRDHMLFIGWLDAKQIQLLATEMGWQAGITVSLIDVGGRMAQMPSYVESMSDELLRDEEVEPDTTWLYMPAPNIDKLTIFFLHWFTTAPELVDVYLSGTGDDYPFVQLQISGGSVLDQVSRLAQMLCPDYRLVITALGQIKILPDPLVIDVEDRTAAIMVELEPEEWQEASVTYDRSPSTHVLWGNAMLASTDYVVVDDDLVITSVKSIAPGGVYGQGPEERTWQEQLTKSQADLNKVTGHRYARINSRFGPMDIIVPGAIVRDEFDYTNDGWIKLHLTEDQAEKAGLTVTMLRGRLRSMTVQRANEETGLAHSTSLSLELETSGEPAYSWDVETGTAEPGDGDYVPPEIPTPPLPFHPPDHGLIEGQESLAAIGMDGYVYRTADFQASSPTYTRASMGIAEARFSWVADPFCPGYLTGSGAVNGFIATENAIYKLSNLFGTLTKTTLYTFDVPVSAASLHWRSIQASFGAFFEANNPWLLCVSYYGNTPGHSGTWATFSLDAGATWSVETQISPYYPAEALTRFNPIGVYASPKTPTFAYTAAYKQAEIDEARKMAWGLSLGVGNYDFEDAAGTGGSISTTNGSKTITFIPHAPHDAVRIEIEGSYDISAHRNGFTNPSCHFFSAGGGYSTNLVAVTFSSFGGNVGGGTSSGTHDVSFANTFHVTMELSSGNWPYDRAEVIATPPTGPVNPRLYINVAASNDGGHAEGSASMRVVEIELADGTIYNPSESVADGFVSVSWGDAWTPLGNDFIDPRQAQAGSIHLPWADNDDEDIAYYGSYELVAGVRQFRLLRASGGSIVDISPDDGSRLYGVNRYGFAIRAFDGDRSFILASVIGNDTSDDPADDFHAVYVSSNEGGSWTQIMPPLADSSAPTNRPAYEAAYGGDSEQVIYIWGPPNYIGYSSNMGASVANKSGNISSLGSSGGFIGIAGGPTGG